MPAFPSLPNVLPPETRRLQYPLQTHCLKDASVDIANRPRIVNIFKAIRDLAPQDAGEAAAEMWETAGTIQSLAKEIQALLGRDPDETSLEVQDPQDIGPGPLGVP